MQKPEDFKSFRNYCFTHYEAEKDRYICRSPMYAFEAEGLSADEAYRNYCDKAMFDKEAKKIRGVGRAKEYVGVRLSKLAIESLSKICDYWGTNESKAIEIMIYWHESLRLAGPEPLQE